MPGTTTTVEGGVGRPPWPENPGSERLAGHFMDAAEQLGQAVKAQPTGEGAMGISRTWQVSQPSMLWGR